MESTEIGLIVFFIGLLYFFLQQHLNELKSKVDILLASSNVDWNQYITADMKEKMSTGDDAKAAMMLRADTGLSFLDCQKIIRQVEVKT
jgi:hypothetical protein